MFNLLPDELKEKIEVTDTCWFWKEYTDSDGYGRVYWTVNSIHRQRSAARVIYSLLVKDILSNPDLETHHKGCSNRNCVNPDHLELLLSRTHSALSQGSKTHCKRGHPFTKENTYIRPDGGRQCRTCHRAAVKVSQKRTKTRVLSSKDQT